MENNIDRNFTISFLFNFVLTILNHSNSISFEYIKAIDDWRKKK